MQWAIRFFMLKYVIISVTISAWKLCSVRLYLQFYVGRFMSYFYVISVCLRIVVSNIVVFLLCFSSSCQLLVLLDCPFLLPLRYFLTFIYCIQENHYANYTFVGKENKTIKCRKFHLPWFHSYLPFVVRDIRSFWYVIYLL
jgi:hypothetical protein